MRKLILKMSKSVDGFVVGPKGDQSWIFRTVDDACLAWELEIIQRAGLHVMGSHTYGEMAAHWPWSTESLAEPMNTIPKAVFSRRSVAEITRDVGKPSRKSKENSTQPSAKPQPPTAAVLESWRTPRVLSGALSDELRRLKDEPGNDVIIYGGAILAQNVVASGLVDEYIFLTHPAALGGGVPLFSKLERPIDLELVYAKSFSAGGIGQVYRPKKR